LNTRTSSEELIQLMQSAIEAELKYTVSLANHDKTTKLHHMLAYHLGWEGEGAGADARGKRIRPLLLLLTCLASGGNWKNALPASAAVELVHNFSLIHDDIQDNSPLRRGRTTVWKHWGLAQAINAGDAMFTLAHLSLLRSDEHSPPDVVVKAARILQYACLHLTQGQYLDLDYETRKDITIDDYWPMVEAKTATLIATCTQLGALISGAEEARCAEFRRFGLCLGLAFQVQDDLLGIWGDGMLTGKSTHSDLISGKKSLPVLFGISQKGSFYNRWIQGPIKPGEVPQLAEMLDIEGAHSFTQEHANRLTEQALQALKNSKPDQQADEILESITLKLLSRKS
jgi:geranylgeranyl diphosphate synthase, type I